MQRRATHMEPVYVAVERRVRVLGQLCGVPVFLERKEALLEALAVDLAPADEAACVAHEDRVEARVEELRREGVRRGEQRGELVREPLRGGTYGRHDEWTRLN